jgi:DNA-binding PadR family transcriptional regulator
VSTTTTLLALLEGGPSHGYTLKQRYDRWFSRKRPLAFGQVYATLGRLQRDGLAQMVDVEAGDGPDRHRYAITPDGSEAVDRWVFGAGDPEVFATSDLYTRVTVALLSGRPADRVLATQREAHLERMRELQQRRRSATGADLLAVTDELAHLDADLTWIEESGQRLETVRTDISGNLKGEADARG